MRNSSFKRQFRYFANILAFVTALQLVWFFTIMWSFNSSTNEGTSQEGNHVLATSITMVEVVLVVFGLGLALIAFLGYGVFKRDVEDQACRTAQAAAKPAAKEASLHYLENNAQVLLEQALDNDELISKLQIRIKELGIDASDDAETVDDDADWTPDDPD